MNIQVVNYVFTYVKGVSAESQPSKMAQVTISADGQAVEITIPTNPPIPSGVDSIYLYRMGAGAGTFLLLNSDDIISTGFAKAPTAITFLILLS